MNIIYLRISKNEEYQNTEHQRNSCIEFCKANNIAIDEIIEDSNVSAYSKSWEKREGFTKIMNIASEGNLENLVVFESSRISRQFMQGQLLVDELTKFNVKIWSVTDNNCINTDELSQLMNSFKFFMNQKSSVETSRRVKSQKKMAKERGDYLGHRVLWGFKVVEDNGRKIEVVDEEKIPLIIDMFETYINYGNKACLKKFNISGHTVLLQKLKNEKYRKIVGDVLFDRTQAVIKNRVCKSNSNTKFLNRSEVIFEGLLYHAEPCGHKLTISRERNGNELYRCRKCKGNPKVKMKKSFNNKLTYELNKSVEAILNNLDHEELQRRYDKRCGNKQAIIDYKIKELNNLLTNKGKAFKMANAKLERYIMEDANDVMISTISNMIENTRKEMSDIKIQLEEKKKEMDKIKQESAHQEELIKEVLNARDIYKKSDNEKKKAILNLIINRIEVADIKDFNIFFNI